MPRNAALLRALWGGVALGLLFFLALTLWLAHSGIFFPYQLDYGEGIVLWFTRELALGHPIYKGLEGLPYASSNYPPLGFILALPFRALFGDTYVGGRWLNFASTCVTAAVLYRIVWSEGSRRAAALSALFFLGSSFIYHWVPLFRVDLIGLAFTVTGVFFVWLWQVKTESSQSASHGEGRVPQPWFSRDLALAAVFFLAAIYTKHSLIFAPAAAVVAILLTNRRAAITFSLVLAISTATIFVVLDLLTSGGFVFGLVTSNATLWLWSTFLSTISDFLWTYLVLIALALWGWVLRVRQRRVGVVEVYAGAAVVSLALAGRVGAWENYYLEAVFAVCVFAGFAMAPLVKRGLSGPLWLPLLLLIQLALFWREHDPRIALNLMQVTTEGNREVAPLVRSPQGVVISEDMGLLVTNGKPVDYYTFQYSSLARSGQWDQHWELENLRSGRFPLVILNQGTREDVDHFRDFTHEFVSALDYGYGLTLENARYKVYSPAPLAHLTNVDLEGKVGLVGWSLAADEPLSAGESLVLTCVWKAEQQLDARYTEFAHLEETGGGVVAQDDHEPRVGSYPEIQPYPTTSWAPGEVVRDTFTLRIPAKLNAGRYTLWVGWYDSVTQDRLTVAGEGDYIDLMTLDVR